MWFQQQRGQAVNGAQHPLEAVFMASEVLALCTLRSNLPVCKVDMLAAVSRVVLISQQFCLLEVFEKQLSFSYLRNTLHAGCLLQSATLIHQVIESLIKSNLIHSLQLTVPCQPLHDILTQNQLASFMLN